MGAVALSDFQKYIGDLLPLKPLNTDLKTPGALNSQCGADYVKTRQAPPPSIIEAGVLTAPDTRAASFDGDADRIVYYYLRDGKTFRLLDGDKIAVLAALFIEDLVKRAKLTEKLKVGVVQTAYANGSSTKFIKAVSFGESAHTDQQRNIPVSCTPTGVKHLHHAALRYDIGVYFEANGHGTVLFSPDALSTLKSTEPSSPDQKTAIKNLVALSELINQAVGDALSDLLLVEVVLAHRGYGAPEWDAGYEDLPNRLVKVEVPDRNIFKTTDAERKLTSPEGLQAQIDEAVQKVEQGRSFVRPSGTEDCVRVYAEAANTSSADSECHSNATLISRLGRHDLRLGQEHRSLFAIDPIIQELVHMQHRLTSDHYHRLGQDAEAKVGYQKRLLSRDVHHNWANIDLHLTPGMVLYAHEPALLLPLLEPYLPYSVCIVGAIRTTAASDNPLKAVYTSFPDLSSPPPQWQALVALPPPATQMRIFHTLEAESNAKEADITAAQGAVGEAVAELIRLHPSNHKAGAIHHLWCDAVHKVVGGPDRSWTMTYLAPEYSPPPTPADTRGLVFDHGRPGDEHLVGAR